MCWCPLGKEGKGKEGKGKIKEERVYIFLGKIPL